MNRLAEHHDDAVMESVFLGLKEDALNCRHYRMTYEACAEVCGFAARICNPKRRNSTLGGISPTEFEKIGKRVYVGER